MMSRSIPLMSWAISVLSESLLSEEWWAMPILRTDVIHVATIGHILHGFQSKTMRYRRLPLWPKHGSECRSELTKIGPLF
jgi:hypothetical protein